MFKKFMLLTAAGLMMVACSSSSKPRIVQASTNMPEVHLTQGMATQIEMPAAARVQSVTVGNPALVTADRAEGVVNLLAKEGAGETNLIIRATDSDGDPSLYQYRLIVGN